MRYIKKKIRILNTLVILLLFNNLNFSQNSINGKISDSASVPLPFCALALLNASDSSIVKGNITDENGGFTFINTLPGFYILKASSVGFKDGFSSNFKIDSLTKEISTKIILKNSYNNLNEVTVTVIKKTIEIKNGVITMNIENSPLASGNTVFDLIKKLPGVFVDSQNNIILNGRGSVRILINGQIQRISNEQLVLVLMGMNAELVSKIEVMKNPPAKYDAEGSGGLINIITKKVNVIGLSGSINSNINKGDFYRGSVDGSLNYKYNKLVVFSNFGYANRIFDFNYKFDRTFGREDSLTYLKQNGNQRISQELYHYKLGSDFYINKKNTIGFLISGGVTSAPIIDIAKNEITGYNNFGYNYTTSSLQIADDFTSPNYNINFEHKFDTTGTVINFSADFSDFKEKVNRLNENLFLNNIDLETLPQRNFKSITNSEIKIFTQKVDFTKSFKKNLVFECGLKSTIVQNTNDYTFERKNTFTGNYENDTIISNKYLYNEEIFAGYFNFKKEFKYTTYQIGARIENTIIDAKNNLGFKLNRNYFNFFPNLSFDYHKSAKHGFQLNFSERIDRPSYKDVNPYLAYQDFFYAIKGNPTLFPQINYSGSFVYVYNEMLYNTVGYYLNTNYMLNLDLQLDTTNLITNTIKNIKSNSGYYYNLYIQKQLKSWWSLTVSGDVFYQIFNGNINNAPFDRTLFGYDFSINNDLILFKKLKVQVNGYYYSPTIYGITSSSNFWWVDLALKKTYLNDNLIFNLSFSDIFHTNFYSTKTQFGDQNYFYRNIRDTRRVSLSVIYKFGKIKVNGRQSTSNDNEKVRLDSQLKK